MYYIAQIAIPLCFVLAAYCQLEAEAVIYNQKDNKYAYASLESKRKFWRNGTGATFGLIGILIGFSFSWNIIAPVVFGLSAFYILFDGWYATKVKHKSFWYVGITSKLDRFLKTETRSRLFKVIFLLISFIGYVANML